MEWRDEGILLWVRRHGEQNAVIETLTPGHGRHAGLVRGGASKSVAPLMQPGAQLSLEWSARLAEHLGTYKIDLVRSRAATIMANRDTLACLNVISALLVQFLPEREPNEVIYDATLELVDSLSEDDRFWPLRYATWELKLLQVLGFGLDLTTCASTGTKDDLAFVSPRSGRAVCRSAGAPFADRMLPLPAFLLGESYPSVGDAREALRLTGYFLKHWVCESYDLPDLPQSRTRLIRLLEHYEPPAADEPGTSYSQEELDWLAKFDAVPEGAEARAP